VAKYLFDFRFKLQRRWVGSLGLSCDAEFGESMEVQDLKKRFDRREKYVCELDFPDFPDVFELHSPEFGDIKVCSEKRAIDSGRSG
jgi:hypothetical protein